MAIEIANNNEPQRVGETNIGYNQTTPVHEHPEYIQV